MKRIAKIRKPKSLLNPILFICPAKNKQSPMKSSITLIKALKIVFILILTGLLLSSLWVMIEYNKKSGHPPQEIILEIPKGASPASG